MRHHPSPWQRQARAWIAARNALGHTPTPTEVVEGAGTPPADRAERRNRHRSLTTLVVENVVDQVRTPDGYVLIASPPKRGTHRAPSPQPIGAMQ